MKRILIGLAFGMILAAQPYGGRPQYNSDRGYSMSSFSERIARGERMGLLTRREAARLWDMDRDLRIAAVHAQRSGFGMSHRERQRLAEMSVRLDREISRQMREGERNYRGGAVRW